MRWGLRAVAIVALLAAGAHAGPVTFELLGDLDGGVFWSEACGVSNDGSRVVGTSESFGALGWPSWGKPFLWTEDTGMQPILPDTGWRTWAKDVSGDGSTVVGNAFVQWTSAFNYPVRFGDGVVHELPPLPGHSRSRGVATAVSNDGQHIIGHLGSRAGVYPVLWVGESAPISLLESIGTAVAISADGRVVAGTDYGSSQAFCWTEATGALPISMPDWYGSTATVLSGDGSTVFGTYAGPSGTQAFRWNASDGVSPLPNLPSSYTGVFNPRASSWSGDVLGGTSGSGALLWSEANGYTAIADTLADAGIDLAGFRPASVEDMTPGGRTAVGWGQHADGRTEAFRITLGITEELTSPRTFAILVGSSAPAWDGEGNALMTLPVADIVGLFEAGEEVVGSVSGARGRVDTTYDDIVRYGDLGLPRFRPGETVIGLTSGATALADGMPRWVRTDGSEAVAMMGGSLGWAEDVFPIWVEYERDGESVESRIASALDSMVAQGLRPGDTVLFYYYGHGGGGTGPGVDEWLDAREDSKVSDDDLTELLKSESLREVRKVVILDACHSGGFWNADGLEGDSDLESLEQIAFFASAWEGVYGHTRGGTGVGEYTWRLVEAGLSRESTFGDMAAVMAAEYVHGVEDLFLGHASGYGSAPWEPLAYFSADFNPNWTLGGRYVPEPSTAALFGLGLIGVAVVVRVGKGRVRSGGGVREEKRA